MAEADERDPGSAAARERTPRAAGEQREAAGGADALARDFAVIIVDWRAATSDASGGLVGEEVARALGAAGLCSAIERLTALGVDVVLLADEDVAVVDGLLRARPPVEGRLFLMPSQGAEVYVVGPTGPRLLQRRQAAAEEAAALSTAAEALRARLAAAGAAADLAAASPDRRAVVLRARSRAGTVSGGPQTAPAVLDEGGLPSEAEVTAWAVEAARDAGLPGVGVRVAPSRVEIGLTDMADALRRVHTDLVQGRGRRPEELLVVVASVDGVLERLAADLSRAVPEAGRATVVAIGPRRGGLPPGVLRLEGGVDGLLEVLEEQIARRARVARERFPQPVADPAWRFEVHGFDPFREREVETWLTVANGATGTRGALEEGSAVSTPATLVAGVFGDDTSEPRIRKPVPAPDWLGLRLTMGDMRLAVTNGELLDHERVLDMRHGVVYRFWRQRDVAGRTFSVRTARFASMDDRSVMAIRAEAVPEDSGGRLVWEGLVGVSHAGGPTRETRFEALGDAPGFIAVSQGRNGGGHALAVTTRPAAGSPIARRVQQGRDVIGGRLEPGEPATVDRFAAIAAARTRAPSPDVARRALRRAEELGYDELLARHSAAWIQRWRDADLVVDGDHEAQRALRFSIFHLISTGHPTNERVSIGARGLGGLSYFLHVFWDTEVFVLPFFVYSHPQTARTLLAYRYHNLDGAREKARLFGHRGALFPWESADKGVEVTPPYGFGPDGEIVPILSGLMEHHISADVAWAVWQYWKGTADDDFMATMGVELLLETARFWASRASRDADGRYHIRTVVGPDEYHEGVDDNAYTNVLARWNIRRAAEALVWLEGADPKRARALRARLALRDRELAQWTQVADTLVDGFDPKTLIYEQFAGFHQMDEVPIEKLRPRPMAADVLLGREVTLRSKVIKQADTVMLCHVLADELPREVMRANYEYYEPITCHGSSLSPSIYAAVAARLGDMDTALADFAMAAAIDLADNMGNAARGLHMAAMGGLWQAAVMGFGGIRRVGESLVVDPALPPRWHRFSVPLCFRGARLEIEVRRQGRGARAAERLGITVENAPVRVVLDGRERTLVAGRHLFRREEEGPWRKDKA
ncbi:MAG TPA: glycosyl hydrolase family 65 protein [Thermoleophilia bacterium]|nr:glycosyl hydrolase family 65 protein [Thermoleophilia bacterium]HQG03686.1 glycosyl hydrolase family 65 protein [Thermoleophilia bacterium]HQG54388.1 glycosyl hydrolase family 65 protein [Thermoleophilia bacterium]HQJ97935.1 glycosyl hydrolase family 65 protein [Thermoleophilia bacterium]